MQMLQPHQPQCMHIEQISSYWRFALAAPDPQESNPVVWFQQAMITIVEIYESPHYWV